MTWRPWPIRRSCPVCEGLRDAVMRANDAIERDDATAFAREWERIFEAVMGGDDNDH